MSQAATLTSTTGITAAQKTYYVDRFMTHFKEVLVADQFSQKQPIPAGEGKTVDFFRYHPLAKVTAAGSEGKSGDFTYTALQGMNITAALETWYGNPVQFSTLHYMTSRDKYLSKAVDLVAQQAAESCERNIIKTLCEKNIWPLPANAVNSAGVVSASNYNEDVAATSAVSTTVLRLQTASFTLAGKAKNDRFNGGWVCISRGKGYGHCSRISDYASANLAMTLIDAIPETPQSAGNSYPTKLTIAAPFSAQASLTSSDKITTALLQKAAEVLWKNGAKPFDDGYYACLITPEVHRQLLSDSQWRATAQNAPSAADGGYQPSEIARWGQFKMYRMTTRARYATAAATFNSFSETTGRMYVTLCVGQDSFGTVALEGRGEPDLIIKMPKGDDGNTSNPLNTFGTIGWVKYWVVKPLNANFCVGIMSYV